MEGGLFGRYGELSCGWEVRWGGVTLGAVREPPLHPHRGQGCEIPAFAEMTGPLFLAFEPGELHEQVGRRSAAMPRPSPRRALSQAIRCDAPPPVSCALRHALTGSSSHSCPGLNFSRGQDPLQTLQLLSTN